MASTKPTTVSYSSKLEPMLEFLRGYLGEQSDGARPMVTAEALEVFFLNYPAAFADDFLGDLGLPRCERALIVGEGKSPAPDEFVERLANLEGECVFLLRDAANVLKEFRNRTDRGLGLVVNRAYLCRAGREEDYFDLIGLIYGALLDSADADAFLSRYFEGFQRLMARSPHFEERARGVADYVARHLSSKRITWVDFGFQYTFVLFCLASVAMYTSDAPEQDYVCYTTYPWLHDRFRGHYYSAFTTDALTLEISGIRAFEADLHDRASGALAGFAVGDALGLPVAGVEVNDVPTIANVPIEGFQESSRHPYFADRKAGEVTSNTEMMHFSGSRLLVDGGFSAQCYARAFAAWGQERLTGRRDERWIGPTTKTALVRLIEGESSERAGSTESASCACLYRVVPLALQSYLALGPGRDTLRKEATELASLTHNSPTARCGSALFALLLADLIIGTEPRSAASASLAAMRVDNEDPELLALVTEAIEASDTLSDEEARQRFGTGSPMRQLLPLSVFFLLKHASNFKSAVLAGANSYRQDTAEERQRLRGLPWNEQLIEAKGGNTDGIAAIVGCLIGAYSGLSSIPCEFRSVEYYDDLVQMGKSLVDCVARP